MTEAGARGKGQGASGNLPGLNYEPRTTNHEHAAAQAAVEISLYSGRTFRPFAPRVDDVSIYDIAHALALKTRWGGHTSRFYSVAQHSVLVARHTIAPADKLWGLLHDAGEAYLPDVPTPIKRYCPELINAELAILAAIAAAFDLPAEIPPTVHHADKRLLVTEARDLMALDPTAEQFRRWEPLPLGYQARPAIEPLSAEASERLFLYEFEKLSRLKSTHQKGSQ